MTPLPIDAVLPQLREALATRDTVILEAPPGAGKTTRVPLALRDAPWLEGRKIRMLEPRRLAARAAAEFMAASLDEKPGETVGYRMRLDTRAGAATRIEVITEGILVRLLQADPALEDTGLLIFDEFHERSLDADLGLALALQARELFRDAAPLKILIMSATLDGLRLQEALPDAAVIRSEGRSHPVALRYGKPWRAGEDLTARMTATLRQALTETAGSILAFLPGQAEIRQVADAMAPLLANHPDTILAPLYGDLDPAAQRAAIAPPPAGRRKLVLATDIAETSLTIEGVNVVVDSGLARRPRFDPATGMTRLETRRVSRASATQRAGRAGRLGPGAAWRLWSETQQAQLLPHDEPEIRQADLAPLALQLLRWGVDDPGELFWLDAPPAAAWQQALDLLARLGAVAAREHGPRLTAHGEAMANLPVHPRLAHLLLTGHRLGLGALAAELAALLGERDPFRLEGADVADRLHRLRRDRSGPAHRLREAAKRLQSLLPKTKTQAVADPDHPRWIGFLVACAWPERIARRREAGGTVYQLAGGRAAALREDDPLRAEAWLAVAHAGQAQGRNTDRIFLAAPLDAALFEDQLAEQVATVDSVHWEEQAERFVAERQRRIGRLVLAREPLDEVPEETRLAALADFLRRRGLDLLPWTEELHQWRARVRLLHRLEPEQGWPDLSDEHLLATLETWLGPQLARVGRLRDFARLDLRGALAALLPWPLPRRLDEQAPERWRTPAGHAHRIDYTADPPVLAVKLQEMFGTTATPAVAGGRVPLQLHLLSPARRPLAVTQDLASFWHNAYPEVRKQMKGRYPKHPWPDDPLAAPPTARTKRG